MESTKYRLSRWCHRLTRGGVTALWHALTLHVTYWNGSSANQFIQDVENDRSLVHLRKEYGAEVITTLLEQGVLVPRTNDDMAQLEALRSQLVSEIHLELLYLLVTDGCNFHCTYCFEDTPNAPLFRPTRMSQPTIRRALERFADLTTRYGRPGAKRVVHLYGGEPLLNRRGVQYAVRTIDALKRSGRMPMGCETVIITNGSRLTRATAALFKEYGVSVGISLDGPRVINNAYRRGSDDRMDAFARARKGYEIAVEHGLRVGLSVTLTPLVVERFDEVLDFFLNDLGVRDGVNFNILHFNPAVPVADDYYDRAAECLIRAFERFRGIGVYEERMMRKAKAFVRREPMYADCGVVGNQIVVAPDGRIGVCQDFVKPKSYFRGSVYDDRFDPVRDGLFDGWRERSPLGMPACHDCIALGICGGGCPACVELQTGDRWNVDRRICPHSKRTVEWLIWQTLGNTTA